MPRRKSVTPQPRPAEEQTFEAKTLEEMVCHKLSHLDIQVESSGDYSVDIVCNCGQRRSFGRSAWERICQVIEQVADQERDDARNRKPGA